MMDCIFKQALAQILSPNARVFDYSLEQDFESLWSFADLPAKRMLIVWSRTVMDPELSPINAADCLSPVDWAVCYATQRKDDFTTWPEVMILDIEPTLHARTPSVAQFTSLKPDQFPWLRLEYDVQLSKIVDWLTNPAPRDVGRCKLSLDRFLRDIRLSLTEVRQDGTFDRHAISNIVGPMILRGQETKKTLHSEALLSLLKACGLAPSSVPEPNVAIGNALGEMGEGLGVLLVDDQAEHGWASWVGESLPKADLSVVKNPVELVGEVERQLKEAHAADCRFRFKLSGLPEDKIPVLLLDLRLFSGNASEELMFYRNKLLPLIRAYFFDRTDLAWPSFSSGNVSFNKTASAIEDGSLFLESRKREYDEALTWLPRVLALVDMSLPIILFSSTGRRELVSPFREYGNIITLFSKPRFFDLSEGNTPASIANKYVGDLFEAIRLARLHAAPRLFEGDVISSAEPAQVSLPGKTAEASSAWSVVVHIDESGTWDGKPGSFKMGALVSVFPNGRSEWEIDSAITSAHPGARATKKYCRDTGSLADIIALAQKAGAFLGYVELNAGDEMIFAGSDAADEFHDEWVVDNLWRQMFVRLVECSVFGVARWLLPSGGHLSTLSVRAPTRGIPLDAGLGHLQGEQLENRLGRRKADLFNKWGVETVYVGPEAPLWNVIEDLEACRCDAEPQALWKLAVEGVKFFKPGIPPPRLVRVFNYADPRPMVEGVSQWYRHTGTVPRSQLICAFNLNSHGFARSKYIPILHFAVDGLLSLRQLPAGVCRWSADYGRGLDRLLATNRFLLGNDIVAATLALKDADVLAGEVRTEFLDSFAADLALQLTKMTGAEYQRLVESWPRIEVIQSSVIRLKGRIARASVNGNHKSIQGADGREYFAPHCPMSVGTDVSFKLSNRRNVIFPGETIIVENVEVLR